MQTLNLLVSRRVWLTVLIPLVLTGCNQARTVAAQDALYCEKQGFPPGTDANFNCALQRGAERTASGAPEGPDPVLTPIPLGPPAPPPRAGGVRQIVEVTVAPGITATPYFAFTLKDDCTVDGVPTMTIDKKPEHGVAHVAPRVDYANATANGPPAACADKKVSGVALEYTPAKNYEGYDYMEFETVAKSGALTTFKVAIAVEKPEPSDDD